MRSIPPSLDNWPHKPFSQREVEVEQICFADDSAAVGNVNEVRNWWNRIVQKGPAFGLYVNPKKTWLVVKQTKSEFGVIAEPQWRGGRGSDI